MLTLFLAFLASAKEITEKDFKQINMLSSTNWLQHLPIFALMKAIDYQGCQLERNTYTIDEKYQFTPTWVTPRVDASNVQVVVVEGSNYADYGVLNITNNLVNFTMDFTIVQPDTSTLYGTLQTQQEVVNYTIDVKQNNKSITYYLEHCLSFEFNARVYDVSLPGLSELKQVELLNKLNSFKLLPQLLNEYYSNNSKSFCTKMQFFVEEASIPSSIEFKLDQYNQPSDPNPRVIEAIESSKFQGLHFNKQTYTLGLNVEIFNFAYELTVPLDHKYYDNHLYSLEISMELIETYFNYGAVNHMFDTILNSKLWPVSGFAYKTGDLRKMIPTAYYSFKLETDIHVFCTQQNYSFLGMTDKAMENNTISVRLGYDCNALADQVKFGAFSIVLELDVCVEENKGDNAEVDYLNFLIVGYRMLGLNLEEIGIYKIWSWKLLQELVQRGLAENLPNTKTYGSGWIKNELGNKISYGFTEDTLAIWSLQLL